MTQATSHQQHLFEDNLQLIGIVIANMVREIRARGNIRGQQFYINRFGMPGVPSVIVGWVGFEE